MNVGEVRGFPLAHLSVVNRNGKPVITFTYSLAACCRFFFVFSAHRPAEGVRSFCWQQIAVLCPAFRTSSLPQFNSPPGANCRRKKKQYFLRGCVMSGLGGSWASVVFPGSDTFEATTFCGIFVYSVIPSLDLRLPPPPPASPRPRTHTHTRSNITHIHTHTRARARAHTHTHTHTGRMVTLSFNPSYHSYVRISSPTTKIDDFSFLCKL